MKPHIWKQKKRGQTLFEYLAASNLVGEEQLARLVAKFHKVPYQKAPLTIDLALVKQIPLFTLRRHRIIPLVKSDKKITISAADPGNILAIDEVRKLTGLYVECLCSSISAIDDALDTIDAESKSTAGGKSDSAVISHVEQILKKSIKFRASDVHFEPQKTGAHVRIRVDGVLSELENLSTEIFTQLISRMKVLSGMDIVEKRLAQDGRFNFEYKEKETEVRTSTLPTVYGEKMVLRLLSPDSIKPSLEMLEIGLEKTNQIKKICTSTDGLVLVAGPTGSGKSTTLYSVLLELDRQQRNLVTIEDPVEYELPLANQVQVNPKIGVTFASLLPSILRQDPDIILIGRAQRRKYRSDVYARCHFRTLSFFNDSRTHSNRNPYSAY